MQIMGWGKKSPWRTALGLLPVWDQVWEQGVPIPLSSLSQHFDSLIFFILPSCSFTDVRLPYELPKIKSYRKELWKKNISPNLCVSTSKSPGLFGVGRSLQSCSGCGCVPVTAHWHLLYDPPLRPGLDFLPCHCCRLCCFPCSPGVVLLQQGFAADREMEPKQPVHKTCNKAISYRPCSKIKSVSKSIRMVVASWEILYFDEYGLFNQEKYFQAIFYLLIFIFFFWLYLYSSENDGNYLTDTSCEILGRCPSKLASSEALQWNILK